MIDIFIRNHSFSVFCDRQKLFDANILKFRRFLLTLQQVKSNGPVAQLNRASDSGSECRGFESHRGHTTKRVCQNTQYKNIKLVVCPFMDAQRVFHFSVNLTFKSLVGNKYCVYRHK